MRIAFAIDSITPGGAERVLANMANYWSNKGHTIEILTLWPKGNKPFYELSPAVIHSPLSLAQKSHTLVEFLANNLRRMKVLRKAIMESDPDVVISLLDRMNLLVSLASTGLGIPVVVCEHNDPAQCNIGGRGWELLRRILYSRADSVVVLTNQALSYFGPRIRRRASVIPNGIAMPTEGIRRASGKRCNQKIVSVGRLVEQKGFDCLLRAFAKVHPKFPQWSLTIWGEGPERAGLQDLRESLGLGGSVHLPGATQAVFKEMQESDLFVSSSRFEGFPMCLLEALACRLPVVGFDCPSGTREIVRHAVDGLLVPPGDVDGLANAMGCLMGNATLRNQLAANAGEVVQRFSMEKVMGQWEQLLARLVPCPARGRFEPIAPKSGQSPAQSLS